jgi:uncharacterized damage-inducible protein DinB
MSNPRVRLVIDELARHRAQFAFLCGALSDEDLAAAVPDTPWTVRDYIAHLCTIDGLIAPAFQRTVGLGSAPPPEPAPGQPFDIDDWNEAAVAAQRDTPLPEMLAQAARHRAEMVAAIERMSDADLDRVIAYGGDRRALGLEPTPVRFGGLLWGIALHDPTHTRDILRALPHRKEEAWIQEWLASVNDSMIPQGVREQRV